jgi:predicted exporter
MSFRQRRTLAWAVLLASALLGGAWLLRLDFAKKISTDVLDLIPASERDPELALVRSLASEAEARTMLIVLSRADGAALPLAAAQKFAAALVQSAAFSQAVALGDTGWRDALGRELFAQRFALLFPTWLAAQDEPNLALASARRLKSFLETPEALAFQDLIPADPLLLLPDALARVKAGPELLAGAARSTAGNGLIWAQLSASPLSESGQAPAFAALEQAAAGVRMEFPGLQVSFTGVNRFAAASRARIEREVSWLNALSLAAVLAVAGIFIRALHRALHLVPVIAFAVLGAWVATTLTFERVHVIVFVLGALLTGVAIDYGFYLYMQPLARADEDYGEKVRRLAKPLLASCFTTVTGFALLLFSELPMIRQLGVFVGAGLLCALGAAVAYFATVRNCFLAPRSFRNVPTLSPPTRARLRWIVAAGWAFAVIGLVRIAWHDDVRELEIPSPHIQAEDARIRALFGQRTSGDARTTVYLSYGATLDEARAAVARLEHWIDGRATLTNLAEIVPLSANREKARRFIREHPEFPEEFRAALTAEGFNASEFTPFFEAYASYTTQAERGDIAPLVQRFQAKLAGPLSLLLHTGANQNWFVSLATGAPSDPPPPETHTVMASQLQSLNRLFATYRRSALHLSLVGLAIVGLGVFATYGVRDGVRIFAIPCGACLGIFGVFGWLGQPLNLFHLLGAFLGVCLTHNYSIFSATSAYRREPPPVSVRLSALTTAASFGVLAFSGIPVVRALGITVSSMVVAALIVIELEHLAPLAKKA